MKMFIKTVCITLCISVTTLFFSYEKKVNAEAVSLSLGFVAVTLTAALVGLCIEVGVAISNQISATIEADKIAALSDRQTAVNNVKSWLQSRSEDIKNADDYYDVITDKTDQEIVNYIFSDINIPLEGNEQYFLNSLKQAAMQVTIDRSTGSSLFPSSVYSELTGNVFENVYGSSGLVSRGPATVDGKPLIVTTVTEEFTVDAFEQFGIEYTMFESITDVHLYHRSGGLPSNISANSTYGFFIISNGKLYLLGIPSTYNFSVLSFSWQSNKSAYQMSLSGVGYIVSPYLPSDYVQEAKIVEVDGRLCFSLYQYYITQDKIYSYENQIIYGNPKPTLSPLLFERPTFYVSSNCSSSIQNFQLDNELKFVNRLDCNDFLYEVDVLSGNYECCGFIENFSNSTNNIYSAALSIGQYSTAITGGEKTVYSELSDIEKAIYALAQQQGITYEQMLESCNILINENGEMYLESLDGVTKSIDSLLAEFEKLLEQGDISNEQGAAMIEQLTALLTYLKSLNIEGIGSYIASIETILDGLNQHDEDQTVLLGDAVGTLQDIKQYLDSLGLSTVSSDIKAISESLSKAQAKEEEREEKQKKQEEDQKKQIEAIAAAIPFTSDFKLFNQCKYFIDTVFNYDDVLQPPNFSFYWDSDGDGIQEIYNPLDFSFLETQLTNENMVDKSIFFSDMKLIDLIRYVIAIVIYGLFVMRLIKRLPTFYGSGPWSLFGGGY